MIELGCCTDIPVSEAARKKICKIKEAGFDYVELNFQAAAALTPGERREAARFLEESGLPCRAMNCLLPGSLPVGEEVVCFWGGNESGIWKNPFFPPLHKAFS